MIIHGIIQLTRGLTITQAWDKIEERLTEEGISRDEFPECFIISDTYAVDIMGMPERNVMLRDDIFLGVARSDNSMMALFDEIQGYTGYGDLHEMKGWGAKATTGHSIV
jgi:hypothetical protein